MRRQRRSHAVDVSNTACSPCSTRAVGMGEADRQRIQREAGALAGWHAHLHARDLSVVDDGATHGPQTIWSVEACRWEARVADIGVEALGVEAQVAAVGLWTQGHADGMLKCVL